MPASDAILVINAGSSSVKFALYAIAEERVARDATHGLQARYRGEIDGLRGGEARFTVHDLSGARTVDRPLTGTDHGAAFATLMDWIDAERLALAGVGHRVLHGGGDLGTPVRLDATTLAALERLIPLAPLHQPHNLTGIRAIERLRPGVPQVACFDTAFHRTQSPVAESYALPRELTRSGIRRYGFHGLSYESIAEQLPHVARDVADGRVVVAHLGAGASMCAMRGRASVATTMGFTALDGLPMATRCGDIDPGVVLYLLSAKGMSVEAVTDLLYHRSGWLGVSGVSADMRTLLSDSSANAHEAVEVFTYRIARELGSLAAALGGLDALVFTGGVGEHAAPIRERVIRDGAWLGLELDGQRNRRHGPRITTDASRASAWVIPTDEERVIARHTVRLVR
jgi:acetate kinase